MLWICLFFCLNEIDFKTIVKVKFRKKASYLLSLMTKSLNLKNHLAALMVKNTIDWVIGAFEHNKLWMVSCIESYGCVCLQPWELVARHAQASDPRRTILSVWDHCCLTGKHALYTNESPHMDFWKKAKQNKKERINHTIKERVFWGAFSLYSNCWI
jgi:hypothetical protein